MNILRRLPLSRLVALCAAVLAIGVSITALALATGSGPTPPAKPLAQAVHDALGGASVQGFSANVTLTNKLLEGANLASGAGGGESGSGGAGGLASSPLLSGASGRLWVSSDGRVRLELQSEKGDTQVLYDGTTAQLYDASTNTLYRYTVPAGRPAGKPQGWTGTSPHSAPTVAKIEEAITKVQKHANLSGATPTDVGGKAAYTVRISPNESGSLIGGAELSFDAGNGLPLRAAVYAAGSSSPVIELASSEVAYGAVPDSVFAFTPPPGAKIIDVKPPEGKTSAPHTGSASKPTVTHHGKGLASVWVLEEKNSGKKSTSLEGLPKVNINGVSASELQTALGTVLSFERGGVSYVLAGAVAPQGVEALARGL